ncbi:unnamed protein product [Gulo gulo]|uniref:G-protein coupled receptors family 1 profile domain-containing protein n=1 Tax=Gulo gulo TaxID=48420 RepID=A0A9X9LT70_GULGU|nr:unnamed protein product [Gulo gulo]
MKGTDFSNPAGFILLGFSDQPQLEIVLLLVVSTIYILTLVGNTAIILVSNVNPELHMSMYFFLSSLSFLDLCFTTSIILQMLWNLEGPEKTISYPGCVIHLYLALGLCSTECVLLTVTAYDRFSAICQPLSCRHAPKTSPAPGSCGLDQWFRGVHGSDHPHLPVDSLQPPHSG